MNKLVVLAALALVGNVEAARWNKSNNPDFFNAVATQNMTHSFNKLPLVAKVKDDRYGWSDTYWPSNLGGIAYRWNHPNPMPFKYKLHTRDELLNMSSEQLSELSPAELYDIAQGDYGYSLTKKVLKTYNEKDLWWEGICHGWAQAAMNYAEPDETVVVNKDGIKVPFGASDVKGLLSMHDSFNSKGMYVRVGQRCAVNGKVKGEEYEDIDSHPFPPSAKDASKAECEDVNAGAFHIVLASMIGINSHGFVADIDRFNDVWNQPVVGYASKIVGEVALNPNDAKNGVVRKVRLQTSMTYGEELEFYTPELEAEGGSFFVSKKPVTGTPNQVFNQRHYDYIVEIDQTGNIIGGEWISETRPDMLWMKARDKTFLNGRFPLAGLSKIYKPVQH